MPNDPIFSLLQRIDNDFVYHSPKEGQHELYATIRSRAKDLALFIAHSTPAGREQALALTKLEEAVFWANAGIARHG